MHHRAIPLFLALLRRRGGALLVTGLLLAIAGGALLQPVTAALVAFLVRRRGHYAIGNHEIVAFVLSPAGMLAVVIVAVATVLAAVLASGAYTLAVERPGRGGADPLGALLATARRAPVLLRLSASMLLRAAAVALPLVALGGAVALMLWRGYDLNYLWTVRPPVFWVGATLLAVVALIAAAAVGRLLVRWTFAVALVVLDDCPAAPALRRSAELVQGRWWQVLRARGAWLALLLVVGGLVEWAVLELGAILLEAEDRSIALTALLAGLVLAAATLIATLAGILLVAGDAVVTLVLYRIASGRAPDLVETTSPGSRRLVVVVLAAGVGVLALGAGLALATLATAELPLEVEITAHRGASRTAPENTLAAFRAAIEAGADRIELDVQTTADGAVVVIHDGDLLRVAGDPRPVAALTLDQIQGLDVGSWFGPGFAGEPVPTLAETIEAVQGRATLNIELKAEGDVATLAEGTVAVVEGADFGPQAIITSLSLPALEHVRARAPAQRIGFIVAQSIGDLTRLDVDLLMLREALATREAVAAARAAGKEVHVWTVNDPDHLAPLILRGVAGVITDEPEAMRQRLAAVQAATPVQRLLLAFRDRVVE